MVCRGALDMKVPRPLLPQIKFLDETLSMIKINHKSQR